jgi:uncharacterized membrane protein (DUF106 family)
MSDSDIQSLLEEETTAHALAAILARAEDGDGTVTWGAVSDVVPPEEWGRLVGSDVLVSAGDAFVIEDPPALRDALAEHGTEVTADATVDEPATPSGWRSVDKLAGVGALGLMAGYQVSAIKTTVASAVNVVLGPAVSVLPFSVVVTLLAMTIAVISTVVRRRLVDKEQVNQQKERMQMVKERLREAKERGDEAAVERLSDRQNEVMRSQLSVMVHSLRPMAWTLWLTVPIFLWVSWIVVAPSFAIGATAPALPVLNSMSWTAQVLGPMKLWMAYYIGNMIVSNLVVKRAINRVSGRASAA